MIDRSTRTELRFALFLLLPAGLLTVLAPGCSSQTSPSAEQVDQTGISAPTSLFPTGTETIPSPVAILSPNRLNTPFISRGIIDPELFEASDVVLPPETPVIGCMVDGHCRTYVQEALSSMTTHIVNDMVDGTPLSVTYCDRTDCVRVFSSEAAGQPISLWIGGFANNEMTLRLDGKYYPQSSGEIPLTDVEFTRTNWGEWRHLHPDAMVFLGSLASPETVVNRRGQLN